jgi:conjugal transfer/type IV secretion protein DotA/TraY
MVFSYESISAEQSNSSDVTYEVAEDDILFSLLQVVFGQATNIIVGGDLPDKPDHIVTALSEALNKSLTTLILLLVVFRFIRWVAAAKSQGGTDIFDFQHAPLPILFAIIAIIPVKGGLSFLQMVTIEAAGYSIKISNYETNIGADFMEKYGSYSSLYHLSNVEENALATVVGSICKGILNKQDRYANIGQSSQTELFQIEAPFGDSVAEYVPFSEVVYTPVGVTNTTLLKETTFHRSGVYKDSQAAEIHNAANGLSASAGFLAKSYAFDACGNSSIKFPVLKDDEYTAEVTEFRRAVDEQYRVLNIKLAEISAKIVNENYNASDGKYDYIKDANIEEIKNAVSRFKLSYQRSLVLLVSQYTPSQASESAGLNQSTAADVLKSKGTAYLGVYYLEFMKKNAKTLEATKLNFSHKMPNNSEWDYFYNTTSTKLPEGIEKIVKELKANAKINLPDNENRSNRIIRESHENIAKLVENASDDVWQYPTEIVVGATRDIMYGLVNENDPISGLVNTGHNIIATMEAIYVGLQLSKASINVLKRTSEATKEVTSGVAKDIPWVGNTAEGVIKGLWVGAQFGFTLVEDAIALAKWLVLPIFLAGIFMAFWLPSIPMIHWINTMVGFLIVAFNTFILVPALAISHLITTDNKLLGQKTNHGYMAIVQLLLYLPLVVISFFGSVMILMAGTKLIQLIFVPMMLSVIGNSMAGLLTMFFFMFLFIGLNIQMFNRCFALLSSTPEKLNEYIGGGAEMLDDKEGVSGTKAVVTNIDSAVKDSVSTERMHGDKGKRNGNGPKPKSPAAKAAQVNKDVT